MGAPNLPVASYLAQRKQGGETEKNFGSELLGVLRAYLLGEEALHAVFLRHGGLVWEARLEAVRWFVARQETVADVLDDVPQALDLRESPFFEENKTWRTLEENVAFAFRVQKRILKRHTAMEVTSLSDSTFLELLQASLKLETGLICVMLLAEEKPQVSRSKLVELSEWIADKAQSMGALHGILSPKADKKEQKRQVSQEIPYEEDRVLAEQGMVEFANMLELA